MAALKTGHVGVNVTDLTRSVAFYQQVFGFEVLDGKLTGDRPFVFLGIDGELVVTLWQQSTGEFAGDRPGLHHLAFLVDDVDAVNAAEERVRAAGAHFFHDGVVAHAEGASSGGIFFADPDGVRLEIYAGSGVDGAPVPVSDGPTCGSF
ncbi:VOC family protein [Pseudonocardia sp. N23]|uniref:VOC family protein n=1 Tax=Pseudonocardia sp. N23 TaxID=1987376 RepID=UPI000BFE8815|nr:VOC family protein [Pseudonocardia sp. N23]GAY13182.1 glyoxalase family protein, putative [Pseudonocardia sp. N23]